MPKAKPKLVWKKRAKCRDCDVARIWRWTSTDGDYAVERHKFTQQCKTYPDSWFALYRNPHRGPTLVEWGVIGGGRFRTRAAAEKACQLHFAAEQSRRRPRCST